MHQVAEERKKRLNSERREQRAREKLEELKEKLGEVKGEVEELEMVVDVVSDEKEVLHERLEESERRNTELKRETSRLTARFNSRVRREPQKIETAVRRALSSVFAAQQTVYKVKKPDGTIQDWARSVILHLICESDVPAAKTWTAFSVSTEGLGIIVEGSWSPRSAGRVVLEGALAAEEMIVEDFANALGGSLVFFEPIGRFE
jgi:TolA-binding protein